MPNSIVFLEKLPYISFMYELCIYNMQYVQVGPARPHGKYPESQAA